MSFPFFIANKIVHSKRDSRFISLISIISIGGIAIGVAVLIIAITVLNGFENAITNKIIKLNSHIKVTGFGNRNLPDYRSVLPTIKKDLYPNLKSAAPFVAKYSVIKSKNVYEGITLTGISPSLDNSDISSYIIQGEYSFGISKNLSKIIIGKKLADKLFVKIGDKVTVFGLRKDKPPSFENPPVIKQFIVTGIYESGMAQYDDVIVYTDLKSAGQMFEMGDLVSGYNIQLYSLSKVDSLSKSLGSKLGYPYYVRSIFKVHQNIFTWLDLQKAPIPIVLGLIIIVAVFNIVGTLLMIVLERTNTIGILKSMGSNSKQIIKIFIYQGIYLSLIGIISGNILAFILSFIQKKYDVISLPDTVYFLSSVPIEIQWQNYLLISAIAFALCLLAAFIPSYIASKITPVSAIKFN